MKGPVLQDWDGNKKHNPLSEKNRAVNGITLDFNERMLTLCRMATTLQLVKGIALESGLSRHDDELIRLIDSDLMLLRMKSEGVQSPSDALDALLTTFPTELRRDESARIIVTFAPPTSSK